MLQFKGFKPNALNKIAGAMGYKGDMSKFKEFVEGDETRKKQMQQYTTAAKKMAKGGMVRKFSNGGMPLEPMPIEGGGGVGLPPPNMSMGFGGASIPPQNLGVMSGGGPPPSDMTQPTFVAPPVMTAPPQPMIAATPPEPTVTTTPTTSTPSQFQNQGSSLPPSTPTGPPISTPTIAPVAAQAPVYGQAFTEGMSVGDVTTSMLQNPGLAPGAAVQAQGTIQSQDQLISPDVGQVSGSLAIPTAQATTTQAAQPQQVQAAQIQAATVTEAMKAEQENLQAAQGEVSEDAQVQAAQTTESSVGKLEEAQGTAILMNNPQQREIQEGELISGSAVDASKVEQVTAQVQAATATPSEQATVQGQMADLTDNFDLKNPPAWAAGALRGVNAKLAQRGLGASSIAGQALVQAALESALPIAQADASMTASFERQNLSNRQQAAMMAAEQRAKFLEMDFTQEFQSRVMNASKISDIANMNFTAQQQVALENSKIANTMNLQNLSNSQALVMAEAASLAQLDSQNLSNTQQAAVMNAQAFLQMDMANLSNTQQTSLLKAQQTAQALLSDQASLNAASQFNASSENQTNTFMANLANNISQFNATQANAQSQYNAGQQNVVERFNAELNNQRDQFNAQNQLVIAQSNATWRRQIATADTAAINRANELNATAMLNISNQAYANLWQFYGDSMEWAWTSAENAQDRISAMAIAELDATARKEIADEQASTAAGNAVGQLIGTLGSAWILCWVAREVYGKGNPEWFMFRLWLQHDAPKWFKKLYGKYGKQYAKFISDKPLFKWATKQFMDYIINKKRSKHVQFV
tara:strand:+ start:192 stop:2633 length:2442 start_codon:yes stop_codon:yes gene_type:complete